jgi:hypothetical protein
MIPKYLVLTVMLLATIDMAEGADNSKIEVLVRVFGAGRVSGQILLGAEVTATEILASAGVRLRWENVRSTSETESRTRQSPSRSIETIDVRFGYLADPHNKRRALAEAYLFAQSGIRITVFYDRIAEILGLRPVSGGRILGHVLAHEVGHILLRIASHAENGLMKAHWSGDDYSWMSFKNLGFTAEDANSIRFNLGRACSPAADTGAAKRIISECYPYCASARP